MPATNIHDKMPLASKASSATTKVQTVPYAMRDQNFLALEAGRVRAAIAVGLRCRRAKSPESSKRQMT